jgi:hypothetical protein
MTPQLENSDSQTIDLLAGQMEQAALTIWDQALTERRAAQIFWRSEA